MDPRLAIARAAVATSNKTLGAEAARSQDVLTRQYALASLAGGSPSFPWVLATGFWADSGVWEDTAVWID